MTSHLPFTHHCCHPPPAACHVRWKLNYTYTPARHNVWTELSAPYEQRERSGSAAPWPAARQVRPLRFCQPDLARYCFVGHREGSALRRKHQAEWVTRRRDRFMLCSIHNGIRRSPMVESEHPACSALRGRGCRHLCTVGAALSCCWNGPAHGEAAVVPFDPFMTTTLNPYGISACRCVTSLHKCAKPTQAGLPPPQSVPRVCDLSPVDLDARTVKPSAWLEMPEVGPARNAPAVLLRTLIKPMHASPPGACTRLCAHDSISVGTISARAYGFQGQIDVTALAAAVANLVTDLPILAGRSVAAGHLKVLNVGCWAWPGAVGQNRWQRCT